MPELGLPGGTHGQVDVAYAPLLEGLEQNGTAKGSRGLTAITDTNADTFTFELSSAGVGSGNLAGYYPLELHVRLFDGTTQVAGKWNTNLTGDTGIGTNFSEISASGYTVIPCAALFLNDSNIYISFVSAPSAGQLDYVIYAGRDRSTAS